jgi:gamma-glutamylcyclotransferase (GGCT)/AIG2-like uncharacterized protein YtfP
MNVRFFTQMLKTVDVKFIFVYGTLRRSSATPMAKVLARYSRYISAATMQGVLYEVGGYLGVVESTDVNDEVSGELHQILDSDSLLPLLDDYEECSTDFPEPHEYLRKALPIRLITGESVLAWVYVYNWQVSVQQRICSNL